VVCSLSLWATEEAYVVCSPSLWATEEAYVVCSPSLWATEEAYVDCSPSLWATEEAYVVCSPSLWATEEAYVVCSPSLWATEEAYVVCSPSFWATEEAYVACALLVMATYCKELLLTSRPTEQLLSEQCASCERRVGRFQPASGLNRFKPSLGVILTDYKMIFKLVSTGSNLNYIQFSLLFFNPVGARCVFTAMTVVFMFSYVMVYAVSVCLVRSQCRLSARAVTQRARDCRGFS